MYKRLKLLMHKADFINQISNVTMKFIWDEKNGEVQKEWNFQMRFYFRWEIEHLVHRSKLKLETILGDYSGNVLMPDSKEFIVICKKM